MMAWSNLRGLRGVRKTSLAGWYRVLRLDDGDKVSHGRSYLVVATGPLETCDLRLLVRIPNCVPPIPNYFA